MKSILTSYEASQKYPISARQLRTLLESGVIRGRKAPVSDKKSIWFVEETSVAAYIRKRPRRGPKSKK
jgi:hypothetical protein